MKRSFSSLHFGALVASISLGAAGCTREVDQRPHEGPVATQLEAPPESGRGRVGFDATTASQVNSAVRKAQSTDASELVDAVKTLTPVITSNESLENPRRVVSEDMRSALTAWNRAVLALVQMGRGAEVREAIESMAGAVAGGCDATLRGCQNISFFRQDPGSARVLEVYLASLDARLTQSGQADQGKLLVEFYRTLNLALELRRNVATNGLEFLYLSRANQLAAAHPNLPPDLQSQIDISRHREVVAMILGRFQPDLSTPAAQERFRAFIENFSPWELSRRSDAGGLAATESHTRLLSLAARTALYAGQGNELSPSLRRAIDASQRPRASVEGEESFAQVVESLRKQTPRIWENLKLEDDFARNEYFYMIDRLYRDHLSVDDVTAIWEGSRQDGAQLLSVAERYIKIEIGRMVARTNSFMSSVYETNKSHQSLFKDTIEKSYPLSTQWDQMLKRVDRIGTLVGRVQRQIAQPEFQKFERNLNAIRRNIKFVSVYPNMMLMAYFLEEAQFKLEVFTFFGVLKLDTADIITAFFDGRLTPWFNFGNDGESLKRLETLFAFYFALKTDSFQAFSSGARPVDEVGFFEKVIGRYLAENEKQLLQQLAAVQDNTRTSTQHALFVQICRQDRAALEASERVGMRGLGPTLNLNQFQMRTYVVGGHASPMEAVSSFYGSSTLSSLRVVRQELDRKLRFVETMVKILGTHLGAGGREKVEKVRANLDRVVSLRRQLLTEIANRHRDLSSCVTQSLQVEWDRQRQLISFEERHLRRVHAELVKMRTATGAERERLEAQANELLRREFPLALPGDRLPTGFQGQGGFQDGQYQLSKLDLLLRLRVALRALAPNTVIQLPPDLSDTDLWRQPNTISLNSEMGEEEFVRSGLRAFHASNSGYVSWISNTRSFELLESRLKVALELYQLNEAGPTGADALVDLLLSTLQLMSLNNAPDEARVLDLVGSASRFERANYDSMFFDAQGRALSLAEKLYQMITDDETGLNEARELYTTSRSMGHFLFAPDESVSRTLKDQFMPLVSQHFGMIQGFEKAIEKRELADAAANRLLEVGYELRGGQVLTVGAQRVSGDRPRYLNASRIRDTEARKGIFESATNGFFQRGRD